MQGTVAKCRTTATTAGQPADNRYNGDRETDGDGEDDGGESACQRPHRGQPMAVEVRPAPYFPSSSSLTLQDLQLSWQLHPRPGVLRPCAHTSSAVSRNGISDK